MTFPAPTRLLTALAAVLLTACATRPTPPGAIPPQGATAVLQPRSDSSATGTVSFTPVGDNKLRVEAVVRGLTPGEHGFHIHEAGDCSAPDASSARGHFNPSKKHHGYYANPEHHAGDLPNLVADNSGNAKYVADIPNLYLATGPIGIINRSVVIHADPDDYRSQPAGNSGKRVACGVIRARR